MTPSPVEPPADPAGSSLTLPSPPNASANFIHGLIGHSPGGFAETVRHSIQLSCRATRPPDNVVAESDLGAQPEQRRRRPRHLLTLPPEILIMVLQLLGFADIVRLRKTCKQLHALASPRQIRVLMGPARLRMQLLRHCKSCLLYNPSLSRLLLPSLADPGYPLASPCIDCALKARDPRIRVGSKINLGNFDSVWVCRWCGYPIMEAAAFGCEQMHRSCYKRYNDALFCFFLLGWLQLGLAVTAAALAWKYYRSSMLVFAPTVVSAACLFACGADLSRPAFSSCGSASASSSSGATGEGRTIGPWSWSSPSWDFGYLLFTT